MERAVRTNGNMRQNVLFQCLVGFSVLAVFILLPATGRADILGDVRTSLERLPVTKNVRGHVEIVRTDTEHGKPKGGERRGRGTAKESKWFSLARGRLVTTRSVEESHGSGLGQDSASRTVSVVTLL